MLLLRFRRPFHHDLLFLEAVQGFGHFGKVHHQSVIFKLSFFFLVFVSPAIEIIVSMNFFVGIEKGSN